MSQGLLGSSPVWDLAHPQTSVTLGKSFSLNMSPSCRIWVLARKALRPVWIRACSLKSPTHLQLKGRANLSIPRPLGKLAHCMSLSIWANVVSWVYYKQGQLTKAVGLNKGVFRPRIWENLLSGSQMDMEPSASALV